MSRKRPPLRPLSPEESKPPKSDVKHSSEIDLDEVFKLAREADEAAKEEPEQKKRGGGKRREPGAQVATVEPQVIPPDQEFVEMCKWGVGSVVDIARMRLDWSDPGIHWKDKVSVVIARLINRIQPMEPSWITDLTIISGYTALWVIPNVSVQRATTNKDAMGNDGERKDVQATGTSS